MIPVYTSEGFQRFVTPNQFSAEVAGKALRPEAGLWRKAEKRSGPLGEFWYVQYFKPTPVEVEEWNNRKANRELVEKVAH